MSKVFDDVIDPNQRAQIRSRSVAVNLRSILFMKEHCQEEDVDAVLMLRRHLIQLAISLLKKY
jgi:hypothetical protein